MPLKMKELMQKSSESKSTILFYVKEGLLPEPTKPKPNLHLYDESCIEILKFIKYLQHNFSYTISEIKSIFKNNNFEFDDSFDMMVRSLELISGGQNNQWYGKNEFLKLCNINEEKLLEYKEKGYIFEREKGFSTKEFEIVEILNKASLLGLDCSLLDEYVESAKELAKKENCSENLVKCFDPENKAYYKILKETLLKFGAIVIEPKDFFIEFESLVLSPPERIIEIYFLK